MTPTDLTPLTRKTYDAARLIKEYPPRWTHPNKLSVWEKVLRGRPFQGEVGYAQWPGRPIPLELGPAQHFQFTAGVFQYPGDTKEVTVWHLNFADRMLFGYYAGLLLAQDELQVLEHPALGSLRDALEAEGRLGTTQDAEGNPTPVTVTGVQRHCHFHTEPDPQAGRPSSLYGNAFRRATTSQVESATEVLTPPTVSNILAMAAPSGGFGRYAATEIERILFTAYSAFAAARQEGIGMKGAASRTMIHTGFWGCGAFGGNRTLMVALQALAADLAGVELTFHGVDTAGAAAIKDALALYATLRTADSSTRGILQKLADQGFMWGQSDGN